MKPSSFGIIGGIFAILIGFAIGFFPLLTYFYAVFYPFGIFGIYFNLPNMFLVIALISSVGGFLGIIGGMLGKKFGGRLMIIGSILVLIGISVLGIIPSILMLIGGIRTVRENNNNA